MFLLEPVDKVAAAREFRVLQAALHTSTAYRDSVGWLATGPANEKPAHSPLTLRTFFHSFQVFKMLNNKESLDQIIVATPGLSRDPVALGV